jgi:ABC-2 type transport system ATP-binding protein
MKRRLDLAAALVHQPEVLFLDEPTTGLDPTSRAAVWSEVRYLNEDLGMTIFLTTQYLEEADALANRVGIIAQGKLVAEGTPEALKRSIGSDLIVARVVAGQGSSVAAAVSDVAEVERTEVTHSSGGDEVVISVANGAAAISPVAVALAEAGVQVEGLTLRTPTLDDVFLHITGGRLQEDAA